MDAGEIGTLVRLNNAVRPFGGEVVVCAASRRVRRVIDLVGLTEIFSLDLLPDLPVRRNLRRSMHLAS